MLWYLKSMRNVSFFDWLAFRHPVIILHESFRSVASFFFFFFVFVRHRTALTYYPIKKKNRDYTVILTIRRLIPKVFSVDRSPRVYFELCLFAVRLSTKVIYLKSRPTILGFGYFRIRYHPTVCKVFVCLQYFFFLNKLKLKILKLNISLYYYVLQYYLHSILSDNRYGLSI